MRIVCPNCSSAYTVADDMLGPNGRKVKCASCKEIWHATPEPEEEVLPADVDAFADADMSDEDDINTADPNETMSWPEEGSEDGVVDEASEAAFASGPVDAGVDGPRPRGAKRIRLKGQSVGSPKLAIWAEKAMKVAPPVGVALGLIALVLAVPYRDSVVSVVPDLAPLYERVGLNVNVRGIDFSPFTAERAVVAGLTVLRVEGSMTNSDDRSRSIAPLRLALLAESGVELFVWRVDPPTTDLLPEQSVPVTSELTAPPETVASVSVRFLQEGERLPGATF